LVIQEIDENEVSPQVKADMSEENNVNTGAAGE
jgi:hypothetical protein